MTHKFTNIFASRIQSRYSKSGQGRWQIGWQIQLGVLRRYFVDGECEVLRESPIETGLTGDLKSVCRFVGHCAILNGLGFSYKLQKISFLVLLCRSHEPNPQQGRRKVQKIGGKICRWLEKRLSIRLVTVQFWTASGFPISEKMFCYCGRT